MSSGRTKDQKHTSEPWEVGDCGVQDGWAGIYSSNQVKVIGRTENDDVSDEETLANASRIVAAVNACRGLSTETLQSIAAEPDERKRLKRLGEACFAAMPGRVPIPQVVEDRRRSDHRYRYDERTLPHDLGGESGVE